MTKIVKLVSLSAVALIGATLIGTSWAGPDPRQSAPRHTEAECQSAGRTTGWDYKACRGGVAGGGAPIAHQAGCQAFEAGGDGETPVSNPGSNPAGYSWYERGQGRWCMPPSNWSIGTGDETWTTRPR